MVEAQEREEPLSEAKAGKILDAVYEKALNGIPMVSRSVDEIATTRRKPPREAWLDGRSPNAVHRVSSAD